MRSVAQTWPITTVCSALTSRPERCKQLSSEWIAATESAPRRREQIWPRSRPLTVKPRNPSTLLRPQITGFRRTKDGTAATRIIGTEVSKTIFKRDALPTLALDGLFVTKRGIMYTRDEPRPGRDDLHDSDGGAIFTLVPSNPYTGGDTPGPEDSPFVSSKT